MKSEAAVSENRVDRLPGLGVRDSQELEMRRSQPGTGVGREVQAKEPERASVLEEQRVGSGPAQVTGLHRCGAGHLPAKCLAVTTPTPTQRVSQESRARWRRAWPSSRQICTLTTGMAGAQRGHPCAHTAHLIRSQD